MKPSLAQAGSFACLFGCSLLARPLRLGSQRVGSPCSVVSLVRVTDVHGEGRKFLGQLKRQFGPQTLSESLKQGKIFREQIQTVIKPRFYPRLCQF